MAPASFWKGYLKLSLVTCPVTLIPASTAGGTLRFHTLNERTGHRVVTRYVDAEDGRPVEGEDTVSGYVRGEGDVVMLEPEELDAVRLDSTRTIDIDLFLPAGRIGWVWYDRPYYLIPREAVGEEAFAVIRAAMEATGTVGISRLVIGRRERAVLLQPRAPGMVLWTLRYGDELRPAGDYYRDLPEADPPRDVMELMVRLIDDRTRDWDPSMADDPVQQKLFDIIAARKAQRRPAPPRKDRDAGPPRDNVVNIMEALRRSLKSDRDRRD